MLDYRAFGPMLLIAVCSTHVQAMDLNAGNVSSETAAPQKTAGIIVEVGVGVNTHPAYEGASDYTTDIAPIVDVERLTIPGLVDISESEGGLSVTPSLDIIAERKSKDHAALAGLDDIGTTYAPGVRVAYETPLADGLTGEFYSSLQYAFGGASGFLGGVGANLSWHLTPRLTLSGGPELRLAGDDYMNTYFGVTAAESLATGGRLSAYKAGGGLRSASVSVSAKYEFVADTFVTLGASYTRLLGSATDSPIVENDGTFDVTVGLSRKFTWGY